MEVATSNVQRNDELVDSRSKNRRKLIAKVEKKIHMYEKHQIPIVQVLEQWTDSPPPLKDLQGTHLLLKIPLGFILRFS